MCPSHQWLDTLMFQAPKNVTSATWSRFTRSSSVSCILSIRIYGSIIYTGNGRLQSSESVSARQYKYTTFRLFGHIGSTIAKSLISNTIRGFSNPTPSQNNLAQKTSVQGLPSSPDVAVPEGLSRHSRCGRTITDGVPSSCIVQRPPRHSASIGRYVMRKRTWPQHQRNAKK